MVSNIQVGSFPQSRGELASMDAGMAKWDGETGLGGQEGTSLTSCSLSSGRKVISGE